MKIKLEIKMKFNLLTIALLFGLFLSACKNSTESAKSEPSEETSMKETKFKIAPFSDSPAFTDAAMTSMEFNNGKFAFGVTGTDYKLGNQTSDAATKMCANSAKGQHIHLIVDNEPYAAKYEANFDYEIEDGDHYLLAFLSRSYHESIKTKNAHIAQMVTTKGNSITSGDDIKDPMLFYSRPKGTYVGADTEKVMLDFYLANTTLATNGNKVKAEINGEEHIFDKWQPYYIEGLPMGTNSVRLTLIDKDGKKVDAPLNPVTRTFTLQEDPTPAN